MLYLSLQKFAGAFYNKVLEMNKLPKIALDIYKQKECTRLWTSPLEIVMSVLLLSASSSMNKIVPHEIAMNIRQLNKSMFKLEFIIKILLLSYHNDDVSRYSVFTFQIEWKLF